MAETYIRDYELCLEDESTRPIQSARDIFPTLTIDRTGKVRDRYDLGDRLLIVASDRISTYDCIHPTLIPHKGQVLTLMTLRWLTGPLKGIVPSHLITADADSFPHPFTSNEELKGRAMLVQKLSMTGIECVARGYLAGSAWEEYRKKGTICGKRMHWGMEESQKLDEPIFTPALKAEEGHDENIDFRKLCDVVGSQLAHRLREVTLKLYTAGADYALPRGVIIADTKFEFGFPHGSRYDYKWAIGTDCPMPTLILGDEVLTPDSSRFWPLEGYEPGKSQPSMDKQDVRDWAVSTGWNKQPPAPEIPGEIVELTSRKYRDIYYKLFEEEAA